MYQELQHTCTAIVPLIKPRPNDRNISTQHIKTLLAQHLQAPAKRSQHFSKTYRSIVGCNMLRAFGHHVAMCCVMVGIENRTSAHAHYNIMQHPQFNKW